MIAVESLNDVLRQCAPLTTYAASITLSRLRAQIQRQCSITAYAVLPIIQEFTDELTANEIPGAEHQPLTYACVWADLARLAGVEPLADVAALAWGDTAELVTH